MKEVIQKADVLIEALPYIQRFRGAVVVVKFGGSAMEDRGRYEGILADITFMECVGMLPVVVHGGGKAISRELEKRGVEARFVDGLRVTDEKSIDVVREVLNDRISPGIVSTIEAMNGNARGIAGEDVFRVARHKAVNKETGAIHDWGFVGSPREVRTGEIQGCLKDGAIPVITPLGTGEDGKIHNINADEAAAAVAKALKARKLVFLSDVPGLLENKDDPDSLISTLREQEAEELTSRGVIAGGMMPKVNGAIDALKEDVRKVHIVDGRLPHSLLLEIFTDKGVGTEIVT